MQRGLQLSVGVAVLLLGFSCLHARAQDSTSASKAALASSQHVFVSTDRWVCLIGPAHDVWCWYAPQGPDWRRIPAPHFVRMPGLTDVQSLHGMGDMICALDRAGHVFCWGCLAGKPCSETPERITLDHYAQRVTVGDVHGCAILVTGDVQCWGYNNSAQFGLSDRWLSVTPRTVPDVHHAVEISSVAQGVCALLQGGEVLCWGNYLTLSSTFSRPRKIRGLGRASALGSTRNVICAVVEPKRRVYCWGLRDIGQTAMSVKLPIKFGPNEPPVRLGKLENVKQLVMGLDFGCVLTDANQLYQWGEFSYGGVRHLGKPVQRDITYDINADMRATAVNTPEPLPDKRMNLALTRVAEDFDIRAVIISGHHTCIRLGSGKLHCEWLLGRMPFDIREVWPDAEFDAGDGTHGDRLELRP